MVVCVGTSKGAVFLRSDASWDVSPLQFKGWLVTSSARDASGRTYVGVTSDVYGAVVLGNDVYTRGSRGLDVPVRPGDEITILNSMSGGKAR